MYRLSDPMPMLANNPGTRPRTSRAAGMLRIPIPNSFVHENDSSLPVAQAARSLTFPVVCSYLAGGTEPWASRSLVGRESLKSGLLVFFLFPAYSGFILQRVVVTYRNWGTVEWVQEVKKCTGFEKVVSWWNQPSFKCPRASIFYSAYSVNQRTPR
jgi:hypothetical protein